MSDTNWAFTFSGTEDGALRRWLLRGPHGAVQFEAISAQGVRSASVYLHEVVAPKGAELEDCPLCGKCWRNAMGGHHARLLRELWEDAGCDDAVIRAQLEVWHAYELSTPVPVSEGSQVSGEVGLEGDGRPNQIAATGAGNGGVVPVPVAAQTFTRDDVKVLSTDVPGGHRGHWWHIQIGDQYFIVSAIDLSFGGFVIDGYRTSETMAFRADAEGEVTGWSELAMVPCRDHEACIADLLEVLNPDAPEVPVPVAAQPRYVLDAPAILELVERYGDTRASAAVAGRYSYESSVSYRANAADLLDAIRGALTPVPDVEPELRWGSGPLVDHNPETPAGAKPRVPVAGSPTAAGVREADPASLGLGAGSADPDGWVVMGRRPDGPSLAS